uniref:Hemagglutinin-esterase-fusion glycoprotein n=1 Tax=Siamese algae-eater influenza-like virus TaxID=2777035 RepID=A0A866VUA9_9ORTO|nr:hemagglutinin [Siamese algae-eater influenza-like virus]
MFCILVIACVALVKAETDTVCVGQPTGIANGTVESVTRNSVPVTGAIDLASSSTNGTYCRLNGKPPRTNLDGSGSCTNAEALLGGNCGPHQLDVSYHIKQPFVMSKCYPLTEETIASLRNGMDHAFGYASLVRVPVGTGSVGDWGSYTEGTTQSCNFGAGSSFFGNLFWLIPVTKGAISPQKEFTLTAPTNCEKVMVIWGVFGDSTTTWNNLYGVVTDSVTIELPDGVTKIDAKHGPFPASSTGNPGVAQTGRMQLRASFLNPGDKAVFLYGQGFIAPKNMWCLTKKIPFVPNGPTGDCDTTCVSDKGSIVKKTPFQQVSKITFGDCPLYNNGSIHLVNGTEVKPKAVHPAPRGLFGAIAGFLEGGWDGMINGWYGYASHSTGSGTAADYASTQKAVSKITDSINSLTKFTNNNFAKAFKAINVLSTEIGEVNDKVDDLRADVFTNQLKMMVLLENERILNEHDLNVQALVKDTEKMLGPSALKLNGNCFQIQHKCNETCLSMLSNKTYVDTKFLPQHLIDEIYLGKVTQTLDGKRWQDPLLITVSCVCVVEFIAVMAATIYWLVRNGALRITCCL